MWGLVQLCKFQPVKLSPTPAEGPAAAAHSVGGETSVQTRAQPLTACREAEPCGLQTHKGVAMTVKSVTFGFLQRLIFGTLGEPELLKTRVQVQDSH